MLLFLLLVKFFLPVFQRFAFCHKIFLKKVLVVLGKGCTFAPAFRGDVWLRGWVSGGEFFDSLRPAQALVLLLRREARVQAGRNLLYSGVGPVKRKTTETQ